VRGSDLVGLVLNIEAALARAQDREAHGHVFEQHVLERVVGFDALLLEA